MLKRMTLQNTRLLFTMLLALVAAIIMSLICGTSVSAAKADYTNPDTGYYVLIEDDADLLTASEESELAYKMRSVTEYGNAVFKSIDYNPYYYTSTFAHEYYDELMGNKSGAVFLIDMDNRELYLEMDGAIYKKLREDKANTITDNTYGYASKGQYYLCANTAFEQVYQVLEGERIAQPMKYTCAALLAILVAFIFNFGLINRASKLKSASNNDLITSAVRTVTLSDTSARLVKESSRYSPVVTSSSGSSGYRSSGGSRSSGSYRSSGGSHRSSGGGHRGGGGGHRF